MNIGHILLAFPEGLSLILSPCILPVLPIVLATSLEGGRKRPLGIIAGFIGAFTLFAIASRQAIVLLGLDGDIIRNTALILLMLVGAAMVLPELSALPKINIPLLSRAGNALSRMWQSIVNATQDLIARAGANDSDGFKSGLVIGALIGVIWTPCAGPVMAAAILQIVQSTSTLEAGLILFLFVTGAAIPMLLIALFGRKIMAGSAGLQVHLRRLRQVLGAVIMVMALLIFMGLDTMLLASGWSRGISGTPVESALTDPYDAPEITGIESWINSEPLTLKELRGQVVLIDFWTYSCINCVRTVPHLNDWDKKYRNEGLVIIGVHAPEFAFERKRANVEAAVERYGIKYPVAIDNEWKTWQAFKNRYWPSHYLIDRKGRVVYTQFGEGGHERTEKNIRALLGLGGNMPQDAAPAALPGPGQTPETYLGAKRMMQFQSPQETRIGTVSNYTFPKELYLHHWALSGDWVIGQERATQMWPNGAIRLRFNAGKVFLVMATNDDKPRDVEILLDGKPHRKITVQEETLYELVSDHDGEGVVEIRSKKPGLEAYAFTFGPVIEKDSTPETLDR